MSLPEQPLPDFGLARKAERFAPSASVMFQIELSIESRDTDLQHTGRLFSGTLIEFESHLNVLALLVAHEIVKGLTHYPFGFRRLFE